MPYACASYQAKNLVSSKNARINNDIDPHGIHYAMITWKLCCNNCFSCSHFLCKHGAHQIEMIARGNTYKYISTFYTTFIENVCL